ncbi:gastrula zinc finger protein XlCGF53.1-like isoform X5 [Coregonus clupeaformis]|uniref:gastrula zinc finger protein XlCGF53.1-like isoform X5 n=1 Tax=Coregonus clupeaformis TaxID=59861 RepID=UPI001E1C7C80|nr:gastrula zinc finger protein XlCGF53.1-like isoform X5 [Coregonus clupeaformis]
MSGSVVDFQAQIASIMEVLANAAVAEICKVVDDDYAVVHLKMSQSHKENEFLRRKMKLMELQIARFRAEKTKSSEGSVHNRFHGIRLLNRHNNRETATTGNTWQSRARLSNRSFGNSSIQRDRQPIDVDQEDVSPSKHMDATSDEQSGETEEGEPDLLIIKEEGEADDQDSRSSHPARTVEGSRELTTQPAAATTEDPAFQSSGPRGNNYNNYNDTAMEVSGSDAILLQSETRNVNQGPQQHTGFEPRAERQSLDTKCDVNGGLNLLRDSLNQVWREVVVTDDGASAAHTKVMDLGHCPVGPEMQTSSTIEMRSVGLENHRFHSSSEHVIVIDSVSSGKQVDRDFEWGQVGTATTPQINGTGNKQGVGVFERNAPTMASLHRHSEIPGRGVQQPAHTSLPVGHFIQSATASSQSSNLATHVRPGTIERLYGCLSCHKKFVYESDLRQHAVIHTRKRAFACTLCEKSFMSRTDLQMHLNVHTGEKPFSCAHCGRRFSHSSNLKRHQKLHH